MATKGKKTFSYLIACSDASVRDKQLADVTLPGSADQTIINAAIAAYPAVEISKGNVNISAAIQIVGPGGSDGRVFRLKGQGKQTTIINAASGINGIEMTGDPSVQLESLDIRVLGAGHGIKSTAESTTYRGFWMSRFKDIYIRGDFSTHTGYALYLEGPFRSTFENIEALGVANGMYLAATNSSFNPGNCTFTRCFFDLYRANGKGFYFYTPDTGGQFNICKFQQCEAIDSSGTSTTSVGMHFRGSATDYFATKNIMVDSTNLENFNIAIKFEHAVSNRVSLNYVNVPNGGTMVDVSANSPNNHIEVLSTYVPTGATVKLVNDLNTSTTQPTIVKGTEGYIEGTINATVTAGTILEYPGLSGPGTIAAAITNGAKNSNQFVLSSPNGTRYKVTISDAGVLTQTAI